MDTIKFTISGLMFVFTALIFPILNEAAINTTVTDVTKPLIQNFPVIFLVIMACFPVYFLMKGDKD